MEAEEAAYTVGELARLWNVSTATIDRRINERTLHAFTVGPKGRGSARRILRTEARRFIEEHPVRDPRGRNLDLENKERRESGIERKRTSDPPLSHAQAQTTTFL